MKWEDFLAKTNQSWQTIAERTADLNLADELNKMEFDGQILELDNDKERNELRSWLEERIEGKY